MSRPQYYLMSEIEEFPGYYADSEGTIWRKRGSEFFRVSTHTKRGYCLAILGLDGKWIHRKVHRLVLMALIGDPKEDQNETKHFNGNRDDNRLENISWGTSQENADDRIRHGTTCRGKPGRKGASHSLAKLSEFDARLIYSCKGRIDVAVLAEFYKMTPEGIRQIWYRKNWPHIHDGTSFPEIPQLFLDKQEGYDRTHKKFRKLVEADVKRIYLLSGTATSRSLALEYDVDKSTIINIWSKKSWKEIHPVT